MKIAIVKLSALGDIVHAMIVLQFIKEFNKNISIDWIVEDNFKELVDFHPHINKVHIVNLRKAKKNRSIFFFLKELKRIRKLDSYDLVIDMQGLLKSAIISRIIPSTITLGFDKSSVRESIASIFYNKKFECSYSKNIIERNFELIKFALDMPINKEVINKKLPFLFSNQIFDIPVLSTTKKNVILIPGASHISKRYSPENFSKLINLLDVNYLIIWGNKDEKIIADKIKNLSPKVKICNRMNLSLLISIFSQVDLVIGPDTGPTHIAWALNIPSLTLFGPTPGYRNTYITINNKILESDSIVNPYKIRKNDYSINNIRAEQILETVSKLLN